MSLSEGNCLIRVSLRDHPLVDACVIILEWRFSPQNTQIWGFRVKGVFSHRVETGSGLIRDEPEWFQRWIFMLSSSSRGLPSPVNTDRNLREHVLVSWPYGVGEQINRSCGGCRELEAERWNCWISSGGISSRMYNHESGEELVGRPGGPMSKFRRSWEGCREAVKNAFY